MRCVMKNFSSFFALAFAISLVFLVSCATTEPLTTKYVVRRVTTSGVCQVYDSQASPIGAIVVGGGPFNTKDQATKRMCELRTDDAADPNKCFQVNPATACDSSPSPVQAAIDLPDSVVTYLDSVPVTTVEIEEALLPNGAKLGVYKRQLITKSKTEVNRDLIFPTSTPQEQLSQLFVKFFSVASDLVDDAKHPIEKGPDATEPEQKGLAYNYGSRTYDARRKMHAGTCNLKVVGLDCSGFLFQVFTQSQCKGMNLSAAEQSKTANLNAAINGVISGVEAKDKGKLASASLMTGDIVYWDKLEGAAASHIGIVLKSGTTLYVYQSNGSAADCDKNLGAGRGPRTLLLDEKYWFGPNANWKVLRYEVV